MLMAIAKARSWIHDLTEHRIASFADRGALAGPAGSDRPHRHAHAARKAQACHRGCPPCKGAPPPLLMAPIAFAAVRTPPSRLLWFAFGAVVAGLAGVVGFLLG